MTSPRTTTGTATSTPIAASAPRSWGSSSRQAPNGSSGAARAASARGSGPSGGARVDGRRRQGQERAELLAEQGEHVRRLRARGQLLAQAFRLERERRALGIHAVLQRAVDAAQEQERGRGDRYREGGLSHFGADPVLRRPRRGRDRDEAEADQPDAEQGRDRGGGEQPVDVEQVVARQRYEETRWEHQHQRQRDLVQPREPGHGE
jgi:hypothetical protein